MKIPHRGTTQAPHTHTKVKHSHTQRHHHLGETEDLALVVGFEALLHQAHVAVLVGCVVWCGVVWCGVVWCGVVKCYVV